MQHCLWPADRPHSVAPATDRQVCDETPSGRRKLTALEYRQAVQQACPAHARQGGPTPVGINNWSRAPPASDITLDLLDGAFVSTVGEYPN